MRAELFSIQSSWYHGGFCIKENLRVERESDNRCASVDSMSLLPRFDNFANADVSLKISMLRGGDTACFRKLALGRVDVLVRRVLSR